MPTDDLRGVGTFVYRIFLTWVCFPNATRALAVLVRRQLSVLRGIVTHWLSTWTCVKLSTGGIVYSGVSNEPTFWAAGRSSTMAPRNLRTALLLRTICKQSCCNWNVNNVVVIINQNKNMDARTPNQFATIWLGRVHDSVYLTFFCARICIT